MDGTCEDYGRRDAVVLGLDDSNGEFTPESPRIDFTEGDREFFTRAGHPSSLTEEEKAAHAAWKDPAIAAAVGILEK